MKLGEECKLIEAFDTIPKFEPEIEGVKKHFIVPCTCLTVRKKEKSRQVLAHKRGHKWQIDGHYDNVASQNNLALTFLTNKSLF